MYDMFLTCSTVHQNIVRIENYELIEAVSKYIFLMRYKVAQLVGYDKEQDQKLAMAISSTEIDFLWIFGPAGPDYMRTEDQVFGNIFFRRVDPKYRRFVVEDTFFLL